eukprot:Em0002g881a
MPLSVGDRVSCSASKVLGKKPAKQRFGRLSTTKELYGIVQKPEGTGRSVKYVVYFSEVEVTKAFSSCSLKRQATATNEANSNSDAHVPPSISAVEPASPALTRIAQQHEPDLEVDTTLSANVLHCHRIEWKVVDGILEDWRYISIWTSDHLPQGCVNAKEEEVLAVFGALYSLTRTSEGRRDLWSTITGEEEMSRYPDINEVASWELGYRLTAVGYDLSKHLHTSFQTVAVTTDYRTGERYGLTRDRFEILLRYLSFCPVHEVVDDKWAPVRHLIEGFNQRRVQKLYPGWQLCVDESVSSWRGKDGDFCSDGMPHVTRIERKPGVGCELKNCADADTKINGELLSDCDENMLQNDLGVVSKLHQMKLMKVISGRQNAAKFSDHGMYPDSHLTWSNLTVLVKLLLVACQDQEVVVSRRASEEGHSSVVRSENLCTTQTIDTVQEAADPTLEALRGMVGKEESEDGVTVKWRKGLLYRVGKEREMQTREQLVLPTKCRRVVMELAHSIPLAGHLGKRKTTDRTLQRFYWPTVRRDIAEFCRCCETCQKLSKGKPQRAPLIPPAIVDEPFKRIAMDIVGPLPRSRSGNRYVLVICDFATRHPEAVALRTTDAENVAEELVKLFARVRIPSEILTDQGLNLLQSPDFEKPFILQTDASDRGLGALPSQRDDSGSDHPVAYYSRKLLPREERYSTTAIEKECKEKYKSVDVPLPDLSNGLPVHR